jgi:pre-60S factor REI1
MADSISCNACNHSVTASERQNHYKSEWHRYNVKRQCAGLGPIAFDLFEEKLSALEKRKEEMAGDKKKYKCEPCRSTFSSEAAFKEHLKSKKHIKKDTKQSAAPSRAGSAPPSPSLIPATNTGAAAVPTLVSGLESKEVSSKSSNERKDEATSVTPMDNSDDKDNKEGDEGEGDDELPADRIHVGTCLFCQGKDVTFKEVDECLEHMLKHHGMILLLYLICLVHAPLFIIKSPLLLPLLLILRWLV